MLTKVYKVTSMYRNIFMVSKLDVQKHQILNPPVHYNTYRWENPVKRSSQY